MKVLASTLLLVLAAAASITTNKESPFETSPDRVVDALMVAGDVGPSSVVVDLGSGDGRVVLAAARRGATGIGIDLDLDLVRKSRRAAKREGLDQRATFTHGDIFLSSSILLQQANVVVLYLLPSAMSEFESQLYHFLRPGTVVLAHDYPLLGKQHVELWSADDVADKVAINGESSAYIYRYIVWNRTTAIGDNKMENGEDDPAAIGSATLNFSRTYDGKHSVSLSTKLKTTSGRFQGILHGVAENGRLKRVVLQGAADARAPLLSYEIRNAETGAVVRRGTTEPASVGGEKRDAIPLPALPTPIAITATFSTDLSDDL